MTIVNMWNELTRNNVLYFVCYIIYLFCLQNLIFCDKLKSDVINTASVKDLEVSTLFGKNFRLIFDFLVVIFDLILGTR